MRTTSAALPYLLQKFDLPIYGTRLTCGLIKNKLEEFGLAGKTKFVEIVPRQKYQAGLLHGGAHPCQPLHPGRGGLCHRQPGGHHHPDRRLQDRLHPAGRRRPPTWPRSAEYGQKGVLALLSDSTNAERPGFTATEQKVAAGVRSLFCPRPEQAHHHCDLRLQHLPHAADH